jgi:fatty-acyl-CoA synthase
MGRPNASRDTTVMPMDSTMMNLPLSTQMILRHGARLHGNSRIATYDGRQFASCRFEQVAMRVEALATALTALGVRRGARVATYCWNHQAHLEAYLAVPSMGAVLHTLNVRLFAEQILGVMRHAEDQVLLVDAVLLPTLAPHLGEVPSLRQIIVVGGTAPELGSGCAVVEYEALIGAHPGPHAWPELDEREAAVACYTSGTTGNPKGIVYSHRSIFLHTLATLGRDTFGIGQDDRILLLPSMFHANAWGLPYSAWLAGADLLLPGPHLKPVEIRDMIRQERPTFTALVPTLINDLLQADRDEAIDLSCFRVILSGGSAVSPGLIGAVRDRWGVPVLQGWGMTETSPMCCLSQPPRGATPDEDLVWRSRSGRPVPGMEVRLVDEAGVPVPDDGTTVGELQLRGPWVAGSYYRNASPGSFSADGWLRTGDVGSIDPLGYVQITDRSKDVIKSGGEWVSSVDLENKLSLHPAVQEAAVIGVPDARWEERPLALIVARPGCAVEPAELRRFLGDQVARFWLPEYWALVDELPRTSVGKIDKKALRRRHAEGAIAVTRVYRHADDER